MVDDTKTFMVEDAELVFRNFSGKEGKYNQEGQRNFSVFLDDGTAKQMLDDGWNVKYLAAREEGDEDRPYIQVSVNFKNKPPRVVMITSTARTHLDEDSISVLDWANIKTCDLIAREYVWTVGDKTGIKAYLQSMFVTIEEDELEKKYASILDEG
jgi:hypothetical protein